MNTWIRAMPIDPLSPDPWHLQMAISHSGLRIAECGFSLAPSELIEHRPFADVPSFDVCDDCIAAHRRMTGAHLANSI